jgi:predicted phage terminase large subunit-like protein
VLENQWIPTEPTTKQAKFLLMPDKEVLFGGAAGGGKSEALLMAAAQYVEVPGYSALLLRKNYTDLSLPGALMDRAKDWWSGTPARWDDKTKTWHFPSGATITFGYLETESDKFRYKSAEFQFIGFDELTQFSETQYRFLFSRLRRLKGVKIPIRMRAGTNPGDIGHEWVAARFVHGVKAFIPARLEDNPYLDREEYIQSLMELDPVTREQLLNGDWHVRPMGGIFRREWFYIVDEYPRGIPMARYWDLAASERAGSDPDWTVGLLMARTSEGIYYVIDVKRIRGTPQAVESLIKQTAELDGRAVSIEMEQEPGASGKTVIDYYRRKVLSGYNFRPRRPSGNKRVRAGPVSSQAEAGNVKLVRGRWNAAFLDELEIFDQGAHDDQVDALSGAFEHFNHAVTPAAVRAKSLGGN